MLLSDFSIMYKASANIAKGQKITKCFDDVMSATPFRYVVLRKNYVLNAVWEHAYLLLIT